MYLGLYNDGRKASGKNGLIYGLTDPSIGISMAAMFLRSPVNAAFDRGAFNEYRNFIIGLPEFPYEDYVEEFGDETFWREHELSGGEIIWGIGKAPGKFTIYGFRFDFSPKTLILLGGELTLNSMPDWNSDQRLIRLCKTYQMAHESIIAHLTMGEIEVSIENGGFFLPGADAPETQITLW
jgi:hypothetical protein